MVHALLERVTVAHEEVHYIGDGEGVLPASECVEAVLLVGWESAENSDRESHILDFANPEVASGVFDSGDSAAIGGECGRVCEL